MWLTSETNCRKFLPMEPWGRVVTGKEAGVTKPKTGRPPSANRYMRLNTDRPSLASLILEQKPPRKNGLPVTCEARLPCEARPVRRVNGIALCPKHVARMLNHGSEELPPKDRSMVRLTCSGCRTNFFHMVTKNYAQPLYCSETCWPSVTRPTCRSCGGKSAARWRVCQDCRTNTQAVRQAKIESSFHEFFCKACHRPVRKKKRDASVFCSRRCRIMLKKRISQECGFVRRLGARYEKAQQAEQTRALALARLALKSAPSTSCLQCGTVIPGSFGRRLCSDECRSLRKRSFVRTRKRERERKQRQREIKELSDVYLARKLARAIGKNHLNPKLIPQPLLQAKREQLRLERLIKEKTK